MIDVHSPAVPVTVHLPGDLAAELQRLAQERQLAVDELVREACLAYVEPYIWERYYSGWTPQATDSPDSGAKGDRANEAAPAKEKTRT
jgi:hypothetical protein